MKVHSRVFMLVNIFSTNILFGKHELPIAVAISKPTGTVAIYRAILMR